jgi:uncharacterized coiled-coil protein SlyX
VGDELIKEVKYLQETVLELAKQMQAINTMCQAQNVLGASQDASILHLENRIKKLESRVCYQCGTRRVIGEKCDCAIKTED